MDPVEIATRMIHSEKEREKFKKLSRRLHFTEDEIECIIHDSELLQYYIDK